MTAHSSMRKFPCLRCRYRALCTEAVLRSQRGLVELPLHHLRGLIASEKLAVAHKPGNHRRLEGNGPSTGIAQRHPGLRHTVELMYRGRGAAGVAGYCTFAAFTIEKSGPETKLPVFGADAAGAQVDRCLMLFMISGKSLLHGSASSRQARHTTIPR